MQDLVLVTGMSGAGKSTAMQVFEDAGYFCVDNLPPEMLASLAELFAHEGSKVEKAAVVCDVRGGTYFEGFARVLEQLEQRGTKHRLLFLEASEQVLIDRFKETRRRHPLADGGTVAAAITRERQLLAPLKERADVSIDTSDLSASRLRKVVADKMLPRGQVGRMAVTFMTFGFKHGTPLDVDTLLDVRFLPNPHYDPDLRPLTGHDVPVREAVLEAEDCQKFLQKTEDLLSFLIPRYAAEGKTYFTLGVGCTGGRHRSVAIAEELARRLREQGVEIDLFVRHRDVER